MKKRVLTCCLTAAILVSMTASCGAPEGSVSESAVPAESQAGSTASISEDGRQMVGNMYTEGYPIVEEPMTFQLVSSLDPTVSNYADMDFFKELEEQSNIHIDWNLIELQNFTQKKNLLFASGELPDGFFMGIDGTDLNNYVPQGYFVPLNDLIDQYAPLLSAAFEEHPDYKQLCTYFDGNIYSLGNANEDPTQYNPDQLFIYKPWLDKLGLEVPTTIEEFEEVLRAFKTQDPNGNGQADEIPFSAEYSGGGAIRNFHSLSGAFGPVTFFTDSDQMSFTYVEDDEVKFSGDSESFKEFISFCHRMVSEGLFDQEILTQDRKQYVAKGNTEEVTLGSFINWSAILQVSEERESDYIPVAPLKGANGDQNWTYFQRNNGMITGSTFAIMSNCENPEILVRWIDQFYDKKTSVEACWGPLAEEKVDGLYVFEPAEEGVTFDTNRRAKCPVWPPACVYASDYETFVETPPILADKTVVIDEVYAEYQTTKTMPGVTFTTEETNWLTTTGNDILTYIRDNMAKWIMNGGVEEEWDAYVAQLENMNVDQHITVLQGAYDRYIGK